MTPNRDPAHLFVAPPSPPGTQPVDRPQPAVDRGDEAMRGLRHPFAVPETPEPGTAR